MIVRRFLLYYQCLFSVCVQSISTFLSLVLSVAPTVLFFFQNESEFEKARGKLLSKSFLAIYSSRIKCILIRHRLFCQKLFMFQHHIGLYLIRQYNNAHPGLRTPLKSESFEISYCLSHRTGTVAYIIQNLKVDIVQNWTHKFNIQNHDQIRLLMTTFGNWWALVRPSF